MYVDVVRFSQEKLQTHVGEDMRYAFLSVDTFPIQKLPMKLDHEWSVVRNVSSVYVNSVLVFP